MMVGIAIGGDVVEKWDEFVAWMDRFPKVNANLAITRDGMVEVKPYATTANEKEFVEEKIKNLVTSMAIECDIWVRTMPEISEILTLVGEKTGMYMGYMRIAYIAKVSKMPRLIL